MHLTHIRIMHLIWWDKCNILLIFPTYSLVIIYVAITAGYHSQRTWRMFTGRKRWFAQTHAALWRTGPQCLRRTLSNKRKINCYKGFLIDAIGCAWRFLLAGCCRHSWFLSPICWFYIFIGVSELTRGLSIRFKLRSLNWAHSERNNHAY